MEFNEFITLNIECWNKYFKNLYTKIKKKEIILEEGMLLYPNIMLFTETDKHFILELFGAQRDFKGLKSKNHKKRGISTNTYLCQFDIRDHEEPFFNLADTRGSHLRNLWLSREIDYELLKKRFIFRDIWSTKLILKSEKNGSLFAFGENFRSCYIDNCIIVNRLEEIYRIKHVLHLTIIGKSFSKSEYLKDISCNLGSPLRTSDDLTGIQYIKNESEEDRMLAGQFANLFLVPGLRETTIGDFLEKNPDFLKRAFRTLSYRDVLYQKELKWIEGNPYPEKSIKPDLLFERNDDCFDIGDLKTPLLDKGKITKSDHRRRRFTDDVNEGVAQLANYREYFSFQKNRAYAEYKYGIKVSEPKLILIVGSYENVIQKEVNEASRTLPPNCMVIDYDTLNLMYLKSLDAG